MKPIIKLAILFLFPLATAIYTFLVLNSLFFSAYDSSSNENKLVFITNDSQQMGKLLEKEKIIKHWWTYNFIQKVRSFNHKIIAGEYELSASMTPFQIVKKINNGQLKIREITIKPGDTLSSIISNFENAGIGTKAELEKKFFNKNFVTSLGVPTGNLEGFLLPATYKFTRPITIDTMLKKILAESNKYWHPAYDEQAKFLNFNKVQILTLASIIEGECLELKAIKNQDTLRNISATYHNKLAKHIPLEASSTIYYINKNASHPLNENDIKKYSPFNTFINVGLPPSPIGAPSYEAIKAALYPTSEKFIAFTINKDTHKLFFIPESASLKIRD